MKLVSSKINQGIFVSCFLYLIYLFPTFPKYTKGNIYYGTIITLGLLFLYSISIIFLEKRIKKEIFIKSSIFLFSFLFLTVCSLIIDIRRVVFSDIIEIIKPITAFLVFISSYLSFKNKEDFRKYLIIPLSRLFLIVALMGIGEAYFGLDSITHILYTAPRDILIGKAVSPFGITYFFGVFMLFGSTYFFIEFLSGKKISLLYFIICSIALLSSQSRTIFIAYLFLFLFFNVIYFFYDKFPYKKKIFLISLGFLVILPVIIFNYRIYIINNFHYLYNGIRSLLNYGIKESPYSSSANIRYNQLIWAIENNITGGLIGSGIGKEYGPSFESFYSLYMYRYGFIGVFLYIILCSIYFYRSMQAAFIAFRKKNKKEFSYFLSLNIFIVLLPITSLSSVISDQFIMMFLFYGGLGFTFRYLDLNRNIKNRFNQEGNK